MRARLYLMPGSSPSMATWLVFAQRAIEFDRVDLVAGVHKSGLRLLGFEAGTVPALTLDGRDIRGLRRIARELDRLVAGPYPVPAGRMLSLGWLGWTTT